MYQVLHVKKKYKVMLSLLWKSAETNAEIAARIFYPATGPVGQPCNVAETMQSYKILMWHR